MSEDKRDIRREWLAYITSREQDSIFGELRNPFPGEEWELEPIAARPYGRIRAALWEPAEVTTCEGETIWRFAGWSDADGEE